MSPPQPWVASCHWGSPGVFWACCARWRPRWRASCSRRVRFSACRRVISARAASSRRQPGRAHDPLRVCPVPVPHRPRARARPLPLMDPQGRSQDHHPHAQPRPARAVPPPVRQHQAPADGETDARRYLADHAEPDGSSLIATRGLDVIGYVAIVLGVQLCRIPEPRHSVGSPARGGRAVPAAGRRDSADGRGRAACPRSAHRHTGSCVGLFDEYGPAQRLYGRRGDIPDGRGACQGQEPLRKGMQVILDDDLIIWLTKDLVS